MATFLTLSLDHLLHGNLDSFSSPRPLLPSHLYFHPLLFFLIIFLYYFSYSSSFISTSFSFCSFIFILLLPSILVFSFWSFSSFFLLYLPSPPLSSSFSLPPPTPSLPTLSLSDPFIAPSFLPPPPSPPLSFSISSLLPPSPIPFPPPFLLFYLLHLLLLSVNWRDTVVCRPLLTSRIFMETKDNGQTCEIYDTKDMAISIGSYFWRIGDILKGCYL